MYWGIRCIVLHAIIFITCTVLVTLLITWVHENSFSKSFLMKFSKMFSFCVSMPLFPHPPVQSLQIIFKIFFEDPSNVVIFETIPIIDR